MSDPDHTSSEAERAAEWSPAELDRLEDALERWTAEDLEDGHLDHEDSSLEPRMRERLESYRDLLAMTRAELPMEEVPEGLLAGVLAEAARGGVKAEREVKVAAAVRVGFWERLRRSMLLPGVALAGSAALLLWAVQPGIDDSPEKKFDTQISSTAPARLAPGPAPAPAAAQEPEPIVESKRDERPAEAEEKAAPPTDIDADAKPELEADDMPDPAKARPADAKGGGGSKLKSKKAEMPGAPSEYLPGIDDVPTDTGADKDELRDTLEIADQARRKGRCADAIKIYLSAMNMSGPANERAQARAGYAMCLQQQGDDVKATKYYEAASKLSPSIDAWVKRERGESSPKKAPAKPSSKVQADDPFAN